MNTKFKYSVIFFLFFSHQVFTQQVQSWPVLQTDDPTHYYKVNCTFGEIHSAFHEAIDIDLNQLVTGGVKVRSIAAGTVVNKSSWWVLIGHNYSNDTYEWFSRYLHINTTIDNLQIGDDITEGFTLGYVDGTQGGNYTNNHLHLEIGYNNTNNIYITNQAILLNPIYDESNWYVPLPTGHPDTFLPQINEIIVEASSDQVNNVASGYTIYDPYNNNGVVDYENSFKRVHVANSPFISGNQYNFPTEKLIVWGNIAFIVNCRDDEVNAPGHSGEGMTVKRIQYSYIDNTVEHLKYIVDFSSILHGENSSALTGQVFHTAFNATISGNNHKYGNNDFIELRSNDDIYLRVHEEINGIQSNGIWFTKALNTTPHVFNQTPTEVAGANENALYQDGKQTLNFSVSDAADQTVDYDLNVIVDNFKPFIEKVEIYPNSLSDLQYLRMWMSNTDGEYFLTPEPEDVDITTNDDIYIKVFTSESMNEVKLKLNNGSFITNTTPEDDSRIEWQFFVSNSDVIDGCNQLYIDGEDLAGNLIQNYYPNDFMDVPVRQDETTWLPAPPPDAPEESFYFSTSEPEVDFTVEQLGISYFTYQFFDESNYENITSWYWEILPESAGTGIFDVEANQDSQNPIITFSNAGDYYIKLTIIYDGNNGSKTKIFTIKLLLEPEAHFVYYLEGNKGNTVQFMDNSEGAITDWEWNFGDGETSTEQNPVHTYETGGTYNVSLEVSNYVGSDNTMESFDPSIMPHINFWDYANNPVNDFERAFDIEVIDLAPPYTFTIDYGDGHIDTENTGNNNDYTFIHTYSAVGSYKVIVNVSGTSNNGGPNFAQYIEWIDIYSSTLDIQIAFEPVVMDNNYPSPTNYPPYLDQLINIRPSSITGENMSIWWTIIHEGDVVFSKYIYDDELNNLSLLNYQFKESGDYEIQMEISGGVSYGWAYDTYLFEVNEADCYIGTWLYGISESAPNVILNFEGQTETQGYPGVNEESRIPTNVRWTLYNPNGDIVAVKTEGNPNFNVYASFDKFTMEGEYKLTLESWNNTHGYAENNFLNTNYARALPFYSYAVKTITIDSDIPTLQIIEPEDTWKITLDANEQDYEIQFSILGEENAQYSWELEVFSNDNFISGENSGNVMANQEEQITFHLTENQQLTSRYGYVNLIGRDENGNEVVNGQYTLQVEQAGILGPRLQSLDPSAFSGEISGFGYAVALDGNYGVVGAPGDEDMSGRAFVVKKNSVGIWSIVQELPSASYGGNEFGRSVDIYSNYIVVGWDEHINIYKRINGSYFLIKSIYSESNPSFGKSVAIWGDYIVVGAPNSNHYADNAGAAEVYYRNSGGTDNWGWVNSLGDGTAWIHDRFGTHVEIENNLIGVGVPQFGEYKGNIKLFNRNTNASNDFGVEHVFTPGDNAYETNAQFGKSFAFTGDRLSASFLVDVIDSYYMHGENNFARLNSGEWVSAQDVGEIFYAEQNYWYKKDFSGNGVTSSTIINGRHYHGHPFESMAIYEDPEIQWEVGNFLSRDCKDSYYFNAYYMYQYASVDIPWFPPSSHDNLGYSLDASISHLITGIPYNGDGKVLLERRTNFRTPCEAGMDLELINFEKPAGLYPDVIAENITLGGQGYEANILSGAEITYEANNITLTTGFSAEAGSKFSAISSDCTPPDDPGKGDVNLKKENTRDINMLLVLSALSRKYDYPWGLLNVYGDSTEYQLINEKDEIQKVITNPTPNNYEVNLDNFTYEQLYCVLKVGEKSFRFLFDKKQEAVENRIKSEVKIY